ncbi:MAG: hypothetical protein LBT75_00255 [Bacilli bacterium]|jgi:Leucine-rich repeat (LRR) protein|nr:hypothetical protein [Bacilli bacterium]
MIKKIKCLIIIVLGLLSINNISALSINQVFSDNNLANCVAGQLKIDVNAGVTNKQLSSINTLNCSNVKIGNLKGIDKLTNLNNLDLSNTNLTDISEISGINKLTSLNLSDNAHLSNINLLYYNRSLQELKMDNTHYSNMIIISEFRELNSLSLMNNGLSNVDYLSYLPKLEKLNLSNNLLSNIDFTSKLTHLNELNIADNKLKIIKELPTSLQVLLVNDNDINNGNGLSKLKRLTYLDMADNELSNLEFIINNKELKYLDIVGNNITNINVLNNLEKLEILTLDYAKIGDSSKLDENIKVLLDRNNSQKVIDELNDQKDNEVSNSKSFNIKGLLPIIGVAILVLLFIIILLIRANKHKHQSLNENNIIKDDDVNLDIVDVSPIKKDSIEEIIDTLEKQQGSEKQVLNIQDSILNNHTKLTKRVRTIKNHVKGPVIKLRTRINRLK